MGLFPPYRPPPAYRRLENAPQGEALRIRWLGTAGHVIETAGATLLVDPFLSRPSIGRTAFRALRSTPDAWWHWLPPKIDAVLLGHSHYDHLLDAPAIAKRMGAKIVGSESTARFARAEGVPEADVVVVPPEGATIPIGDAEVRFIPSLHARLAAGRVPFDGVVREVPRLPARVFAYRMGGAFGILVTSAGQSIYHNGSANLVDAELEGLHADVVLAGLAGRRVTRDYLDRLTSLLSPSLVLPTHHDLFFRPLEEGVRLLPGSDVPGFVAETSRLAPKARVLLPLYEDVVHVPRDAPAREAVMSEWGGSSTPRVHTSPDRDLDGT